MLKMLLCAAMATAICVPASASADPVMAMSPTLMVGTTGVMAANDANERSLAGRALARRSPFSAGFHRGPPTPGAGMLRLAYQPSLLLEKQAEASILRRLERKNSQAAQALKSQFAEHDFAKIYRGLVGPFGLRDDDVADIMTAYTALGYLIANGAPDPSRAAIRSLRAVVASKLAVDPQFGRGNRGHLGEEIKLLFVNLHAGWQAARREGNVASYADGVVRLFGQQAGVDLRRVVLTDDGFVPR